VCAALQEILPAERAEEAALIARMKSFFADAGVAGREAVIAVPGVHAFVRTVSFPVMPDAELREAVRWEIKRQIPYAEDEAVTDFISSQSSEGITVTFAAIEKKIVQKQLSLFREAGLKVIAVDISSLALIRAFSIGDPGSVVVIDIGSVSMEISIIKGGMLRLTRTVEMGTALIVNALIGAGIGHEEAERMLRTSLQEEVKEPLNQLLREVSRSLDYYKANFKEKGFSSVLLTGGIGRNPRVREYMEGVLHIQVSVPDPFAGLGLKDESVRELGPRFSLAAGLARRGA
jgi:type IV pilus assembly protein PilM